MQIRRNYYRRAQSGFTLIELMIVVAILGILASVAIASFRTYTVRAQISEGLNLIGPIKTAIAEYFVDSGGFPTDNADAGLEAPTEYGGGYVTSITVVDDTVSILFGNRANSAINGEILEVVASDSTGSLTWQCQSAAIEDSLLPSNCR
ncbi:MAG: pilin [Pseudomonadota bacterium]